MTTLTNITKNGPIMLWPFIQEDNQVVKLENYHNAFKFIGSFGYAYQHYNYQDNYPKDRNGYCSEAIIHTFYSYHRVSVYRSKKAYQTLIFEESRLDREPFLLSPSCIINGIPNRTWRSMMFYLMEYRSVTVYCRQMYNLPTAVHVLTDEYELMKKCPEDIFSYYFSILNRIIDHSADFHAQSMY